MSVGQMKFGKMVNHKKNSKIPTLPITDITALIQRLKFGAAVVIAN